MAEDSAESDDKSRGTQSHVDELGSARLDQEGVAASSTSGQNADAAVPPAPRVPQEFAATTTPQASAASAGSSARVADQPAGAAAVPSTLPRSIAARDASKLPASLVNRPSASAAPNAQVSVELSVTAFSTPPSSPDTVVENAIASSTPRGASSAAEGTPAQLPVAHATEGALAEGAGIDTKLDTLIDYADKRASRRLIATLVALAVVIGFSTIWLMLLSTNPLNFPVWNALAPAVQPAPNPHEHQNGAADSSVRQESNASLPQIVLAALVLGTFILTVWLTYAFMRLGARQLRLYFRELERTERVQIVRITLSEATDKHAVLSELSFGFGDEREED